MSATFYTLFRTSRAPVATARRFFTTSHILKAEQKTVVAPAAPAVPKRKPVGAFRGGLFGFLLGTTLTGGAAYFYVFEEYKLANELLTEDIDALRTSIQRIEGHVRMLEEQLAEQRAQVVKGKK